MICLFVSIGNANFVIVLKAQIGLLVILLVAIGDFVIGALVGPKSDVEVARGFTGFNGIIAKCMIITANYYSFSKM